LVVLGASGRTFGRFSARGCAGGRIRIRERGNSLVVFVAGEGGVEGALSEFGCDGDEQGVGVTLSLGAAAALNAGDAHEEMAGLRVFGDEVKEALVLAGGAAVLEGVEVAEGWPGAGARAAPAGGPGGWKLVVRGWKHGGRPFGRGDGRRSA
jgi:hypothetical protein